MTDKEQLAESMYPGGDFESLLVDAVMSIHAAAHVPGVDEGTVRRLGDLAADLEGISNGVAPTLPGYGDTTTQTVFDETDPGKDIINEVS